MPLGFRLTSLIALLVTALANQAQATVIVNAVEMGGNVVISGGGGA